MHILLLTASHCIFAERNVYLSRNSSFNPVSSHIQIQILQANLHTLPKRINWENLTNDQNIFSLVIILVILIAIFNYLLTMTGYWSGACRPSDKEGGGGGASSRPWDKRGGRSQILIFRPFRPQFGLKIKEGPAPPGPFPWIPHCIVWRKLMLVTFGTITVTIQSVVKSLKTTDCPHTVGFKSWLVTGCKGKSVRLIFKIQNYREDFLDHLLRWYESYGTCKFCRFY